jgi:hypothetical protein
LKRGRRLPEPALLGQQCPEVERGDSETRLLGERSPIFAFRLLPPALRLEKVREVGAIQLVSVLDDGIMEPGRP